MQFCFYPKLEQCCPNVSHCPHLGGAAVGALVANLTLESLNPFRRTIVAERMTFSRLVEENKRLKQEFEQVKLELNLERQYKFATQEQNSSENPGATKTTSDPAAPKKCGASVGHPGWFRRTPNDSKLRANCFSIIFSPFSRQGYFGTASLHLSFYVSPSPTDPTLKS